MSNLAKTVRPPGFKAWHAALEQGMFVFSAYAIPIAIALFSLLALVAWQPQYPTESHARPVPMRVAENVDGSWSIDAAKTALRDKPEVEFSDNRLSEAPFWLSFQPLTDTDGSKQIIEFPSRHTQQTTCWSADDSQLLGRALM